MGEGMEHESLIMPFISSANISCGYHAGSVYEINKTIELALAHGVAIGAHPSYDDRENFGRVSQPLSVLEFAELIAEQIYSFEKMLLPFNTRLHHVKLHGALYNDCAKDENMSKIFVQTIQAIHPEIFIYGLSQSKTTHQCIIAGQKYCSEVFADRTYQLNGQLTPRSIKNSMIEDVDQACEQVLSMILDQEVATLFGDKIPVDVDTICIHGDQPNAPLFAQKIYETLKENQIEIKYP